MLIYDKNKHLGISGLTLPTSHCTQLCYDFDSVPNISPQIGHRYYLHSSVRSNLCHSDKQWVISKTRQHIGQLLTYTSLIPSRVVVHYGKRATLSISDGLNKILESIHNITFPTSTILDRPLLLENAAGQGTEIGTIIEEMRYILEHTDKTSMIGTCLDTCHAYASGYDVQDPKLLEELIETIETFNPIKLIHLNDSCGILGCKVDRHQNIGKGYIWSDNTNSLDLLFSVCSEKNIDIILETPDPIQDFYNLEPFLQLKRRKKYY